MDQPSPNKLSLQYRKKKEEKKGLYNLTESDSVTRTRRTSVH